MAAAAGGGMLMLVVLLALAVSPVAVVKAEDPYLFFTWNVTYGTISPLGVPQQGILINGQFPGPNINSTTNNNIVLNVFNNLDQPFLLTWCVRARKQLTTNSFIHNLMIHYNITLHFLDSYNTNMHACVGIYT